MTILSLKISASLAVSTLMLTPWVIDVPGVASAETVFTVMDVQSDPTWGLDRIDGAKDGKFTYIGTGTDVKIYVVDTGVDALHPDFNGRVLDGYDAFGDNLDQKDCQGHGTHVAGVIAGSKYGVAKKSSIIPVRVLNCSGQGNTTTLTSGIDWILDNHRAGDVSIVNMSLGGSKDIAVNSAVSKLVSAGLVVVAAAGNFSADACNYSPASADGVIAVGATDVSDVRSSFSNYGQCVDIFAPGSKIYSNTPFNYSTYASKSGTSQASPFVSGIIATYISNGLVSSSADAATVLASMSDVGVVVDGRSGQNAIARLQTTVVAPSPVRPTPVEQPVQSPIQPPTSDGRVSTPSIDDSRVGVTISHVDPRSVAVAWASVPGATKYVVKVGKAGSLSFSRKQTTNATNLKVSGLPSNATQWVNVSAYRGSTLISQSSPLDFYTSYGIPGAPSGLLVKLDTMYWKAPTYDGGSSKLLYKVEKLSNNGWALIGITSSLTYKITPADSGKSETYRVFATNSAGESSPSNNAVSIGTGASQVTIPVPDLPAEMSGSVSAVQTGPGSGFVTISWSAVSGATSYRIQKSGHGVEDWSDITSTTKISRVVTIKTGISYVIRVVSNTGQVLGTVQYLGL